MHFGEGHNERALSTSVPPTLEWLFLGVSSQNKISKKFFRNAFPYGSDILTLNSLKYPLMYIYIYIYMCVCIYISVHSIYLYLYDEPVFTCKDGMLDEGRRGVVCRRVHRTV